MEDISMKKLLSFILVFGMTFSLTACGSKTDSGKTAASAPTQGNNTVTESSTQEPTEEPTEDTKIEIQADSLDALEEMVNKDVDNTVEALTKSYEKLKTEINTYNKYKANTKKVKAFYEEVLLSQQKLTTKLREYALAYAKMILASGDDMYDKMDDLYDVIYDKAGDKVYKKIYDGILEDMYDDFYDGILDDAYDNAKYSEWSDLRSDEYKWWSHTRSDIYDDWSDFRSEVYDFWDDTKSDIWDSDIAKATENLNDFAKDIEKYIP